jgi:membrane-bound lytic murein transglycosylase D
MALVRGVAVALLSTACLTACASRQQGAVLPTTDTGATAEALPQQLQSELDSLYDRLEWAAESYEFGIELLVLGEEVEGETRLADATNALNGLAAECDAHASCEMERVISTFDRLLNHQSIVLKQQAVRVETLETSIEQDVEREPGTSPFVTAMPEIGETVAVLHDTDLSEIIKLNGPVKAALDDWLTWMRPMLMAAYENYQYLRAQVAPIYEDAGLPEALLFAMMATETGVKVHAYSRAGAAGPLQFMSRTGRRYGLRVVNGFDMRLDPAAATKANVDYLNDQFSVLNNNLEKALAAYNGGENRMRSLHRRLGGISLWDSRMYYSLPRETREYVPRILASAWLFMHPERYNLEFPVYQSGTTKLVVQEEIAIDELTICLGQAHSRDGWFRTLRNLNPRLSPGDRIPTGGEIVIPEILLPVYEERCLGSELVAHARELHDANYPEEPELIVYTVRRGDTLGKIASRHRCVSVRDLAQLNGIQPPRYVIQVGQRLKIPTCS